MNDWAGVDIDTEARTAGDGSAHPVALWLMVLCST